MANFRNFTLYNKDKSESVGLNDFDGYMVNTPSGLGIYLSNSYLNVGSKRILTAQNTAFKTLTMNIGIFAKTRTDVEKKYGDLRNFLARNRKGGFLLSYVPYAGAQERYIECDIKDFDKTEKMTSNYMLVPVTVEPRTFWRVDEESRSTIKDDESDVNEWIFAEDANIDGVTAYNVITQAQTGKVELDIYGYDKSVLPQGARFLVRIQNINSGAIYNEIVSFDEGAMQNGAFVIDHKFGVTSTTQNADTIYSVFFDTENSSVKAYVRAELDEKTTLSPLLYTTTLFNAMAGDSILKVEFDPSYIDGVCEISLYWNTRAGTRSQLVTRKQKGQKVVYMTLGDFDDWVGASAPNTFKDVSRVKTETIAGFSIPENFSCSIDGIIVSGESNYVASFLYESGTDSYIIAMFTGAISKNTITNNGDREIPLKIRISGVAVNPTIRIIPRGGGEPIQTSKINYTIPAGTYLEIDSDPENTGAWLVSANGTRTNAISTLDQRTNMFLTLPIGEYDIQILNDNNDAVVATVIYKKEYLGA